MADESKVIVTLKLLGGQSFSTAAREAGVALSRVGAGGDAAAVGLERAGTAGTVASTRLGRARLAATRLGGVMKTVGKGAGVGAAAVGAAAFGTGELIKSSVEHVQSLAEAASAFHTVTGISIGAAFQLVAVANATGVSTKQLGVSIKTMANQANQAEHKSKASVRAFKDLGISVADLKAAGGDSQKMFMLLAHGLEVTRGGTAKTAAATKILGRGWMAMNPLLGEGGREMRDLSRFAGRLGITLGGNTAKNLAKARDASFRMKLVMMAVQLFVVNKLVPALLNISRWINANVLPAMRWLIGAFKDASHWVSNAAGNIGRFFDKVGKSDAVRTLGDVLKIVAGAAAAVAQAIWWIIQRVTNLISTVTNAIPSLQTFANILTGLTGGGFNFGGGVQSAGSVGSSSTTPATSGLPGAGTANLPPIINPKLPPSQGLPPGFTVNVARGAPAAIHNHIYLDGKEIHGAVYRVERKLAEA